MAVNKSIKPSGMPHISLDERGRAWIDGTTMRVEQLVASVIGPDKFAPEQLPDLYPHSNLNMARIYAALAWYYDHQTEMDAEFERQAQAHEEALERQRCDPQHQAMMAKFAKRAAELGLDTSRRQ